MRVVDVDVVVFGGGPAGSVVAEQLRARGRRVVLLGREATRLSVGDHLPFEGAAPLARLGAWSDFLGTSPLRSAGICSYWGDDAASEKPGLLQPGGAGWHLDRPAFDAMLLRRAATAGAEILIDARVTSIDGDPFDWTIDIAASELRLRAAWLVDATGRACWLARRLGTEPRVIDELYGFVRFWNDAEIRPYALIEACPDGWWYSAALPHGRAVTIFMSDVQQGRGRPWQRDWQGTRTARRFRAARPIVPDFSRRATSQWVHPHPDAGWTPVGDAALARDPLSSARLTASLASAPACAAAIDGVLTGCDRVLRQYAATILRHQREYVATRTRVYAAEGRFSDTPFWRRRRTLHA
ncbi:NAD(P)/FAD-dependent oxidoreductase [Candidatus Entotheonella palauensis]|uniref:NAD(P)/FAD-dependent oxidoreductase n=1 Tax=Candidatus Entotheonella palauensis TaxID=93172 RepID=UPI000B7EA4A0|nr:FAD-dependent monooxygenase [Candidatus Entotheonella palauensis]